MPRYSFAALLLVLLYCATTAGGPLSTNRKRWSAQSDATNTKQRSAESAHLEGKRNAKTRGTVDAEKVVRSLTKSVQSQRSSDRRNAMNKRQVLEPHRTKDAASQDSNLVLRKRFLDVVLGEDCGAFGCNGQPDDGGFNYGSSYGDYYQNYGSSSSSSNNDPQPVGYWDDCVDVPGMECYYYYEGYYGDDYQY